mmetsp:Transcript_80779/g.261905  ORF Transcript_80779/g.261905 Transcript_80779/m.261905 type:complete len:140 (+) Transcript_80779:85-504(+)
MARSSLTLLAVAAGALLLVRWSTAFVGGGLRGGLPRGVGCVVARRAKEGVVTPDTIDKFQTILVQHLGVEKDKVIMEATLGDMNAEFIDVVMSLEDCFDIEITDDDTANLYTIEDLLRLVQKKRYLTPPVAAPPAAKKK